MIVLFAVGLFAVVVALTLRHAAILVAFVVVLVLCRSVHAEIGRTPEQFAEKYAVKQNPVSSGNDGKAIYYEGHYEFPKTGNAEWRIEAMFDETGHCEQVTFTKFFKWDHGDKNTLLPSEVQKILSEIPPMENSSGRPNTPSKTAVRTTNTAAGRLKPKVQCSSTWRLRNTSTWIRNTATRLMNSTVALLS
jgi:hypothetical protein